MINQCKCLHIICERETTKKDLTIRTKHCMPSTIQLMIMLPCSAQISPNIRSSDFATWRSVSPCSFRISLLYHYIKIVQDGSISFESSNESPIVHNAQLTTIRLTYTVVFQFLVSHIQDFTRLWLCSPAGRVSMKFARAHIWYHLHG